MLNAQSSQTIPAVPIGMKKAQENVAGSMGSSPGAPGPIVSPPKEEEKKTTTLKKPKKKLPIKYILGGFALLLLLIGFGAAFFLTQTSQDVRQQASGCTYWSGGAATEGATDNRGGIKQQCKGGLWDTPDDGDTTVTGTGTVVDTGGTGGGGVDTTEIVDTSDTDSTGVLQSFGECDGAECVAPEDTCMAVHHCDSATNNECTVQNPQVKQSGSKINAQSEANSSCKCVQVDILKNEGTSCSTGHIENDKSRLVGFSVTCPNNGCEIPIATTVVQATSNPTTNPTNNDDGDNDNDNNNNDNDKAVCNEGCSTNKDCAQSDHSCVGDVCRLSTNPTSETCTPISVCNESCSADVDCAQSDHSCVGDVCRLTTNPTSETCEDVVVVGCGDPCQVSTDCAEANHACLESTDDGNPDGGICRLISNPTSITCVEPSPEPSPTPTVGCNDTCVTSSDCSDTDHSCNADTDSCRLTENPGDENCAPATPEATPAPGCNEECYASTDCSNASAVCYDNLCRLSTNPVNTACQPKEIVQTPGEFYEQPELPQALPESGSEDILNWLKVGLGALGLGLIFLFL
jgi:hypothetical protein